MKYSAKMRNIALNSAFASLLIVSSCGKPDSACLSASPTKTHSGEVYVVVGASGFPTAAILPSCQTVAYTVHIQQLSKITRHIEGLSNEKIFNIVKINGQFEVEEQKNHLLIDVIKVSKIETATSLEAEQVMSLVYPGIKNNRLDNGAFIF